ncbi:MAG TPA: hypothetical protein VGF54_09980 [Streptosporangiaceae bacterium]
MTAPPRQADRASWARTAIRRMLGTLRHANEELLRAHEAMARPAEPPRRRTPGAAAEGGKPAA